MVCPPSATRGTMGAGLTRARGTKMRRARWRTPLVVGASLVIHASLLGPLALGSLGIDVPPLWNGPHPHWPDPIDVVLVRRPSLSGSPSRGRATPTPNIPFIGTPVTEIGPSDDDLLFRGGPVGASQPERPANPSSSVSIPARPSPDPSPGVSAAWRAQANALASGPGRTGPDCRRAETLPPVEREACARRFAVADATAATGRLGQRRLTRSESLRENTFATIGDQALANYDERRAPLKPPKPCAGADMMGRCPAIIMIPLVSSAF